MPLYKSETASAIDHTGLTFSPHVRKSPEHKVAQLVARYGKTMVRDAVAACKNTNHNARSDDWWLLATIREIGRRGWPTNKWMTEKEILKFVEKLDEDNAEANRKRLRRRFNADKLLHQKLVLLAGFVEIWPTIGIDERRCLAERAHALLKHLDGRNYWYIEDVRSWPDSAFADRKRSTGLMPDHPMGALHQPQTMLIANWLGYLVFP